ncbi:hypothetical protein C8R46DRAFT_1252047 [Mycena filopes]|nr:hypothetical protein C8R46DRAFT_1252047 [Mycena filopes]
MLSQMPTSALSFLSSSSKGLDGFFGLVSVGIQLALTVVLAEFNTEFTTAVRATATVKLALQPTKCVISNGTGFHPYVAAMGSATIVLLIVSYMLLRTNGRDTGDGDPASPPSADKPDPDSGGQPPSPPEDPETASSPKKRRNRWTFFLLIILVTTILLSLGAALFITCLVPKLRFPSPLQVLAAQTSRVTETFSAYGSRWVAPIISALSTPIFLHGRQYARHILLALTTHVACIFLGFGFRRLRRYVVTFEGDSWAYPFAGFVLPLAIMALPPLRWSFWLMYYCVCRGYPYSFWHEVNPIQIPSNWLLLADFTAADITMVTAPIALHVLTMCLESLLLGLVAIPATAAATFELFNWWPRVRVYLELIFSMTGFHVTWYSAGFAHLNYNLLQPHVKALLVWRSLFSSEARETLRLTFWFLVERYRTWKSYQIDDFATLGPEFRRACTTRLSACWEVWHSLGSTRQLTIILPAVIFYAYFDIGQPCLAVDLRASPPRSDRRAQIIPAVARIVFFLPDDFSMQFLRFSVSIVPG